MVFSRLRQTPSWSSQNCPEELARLRDAFPDEKPERLDQVLKGAKGNYLESVQSLDATHDQARTGSVHQHRPRKLHRPAQILHANLYPITGHCHATMHPHHQFTPFPASERNNQYTGHAPPQYQSVIAPLPTSPGDVHSPHQNPTPQYVRSHPLPTIPQDPRHLPDVPMPVPPFPSTLQPSPYPQQSISLWTPYQPALDRLDSRGMNAVPLYELPPPDLMDYDMSYMIAMRILLE